MTVVIRGTHQPRYRNVATQYFSWLLREQGQAWSYPGESIRVVYAESLGQEDVRDLLAAVIIDAEAGTAFFGDPWRLNEDLLSQGAAECIKQLDAAAIR